MALRRVPRGKPPVLSAKCLLRSVFLVLRYWPFSGRRAGRCGVGRGRAGRGGEGPGAERDGAGRGRAEGQDASDIIFGAYSPLCLCARLVLCMTGVLGRGEVGRREKRKEETRKGRQERGLRVPGETSRSDAPRSTTGSAAGVDSVACIAASTAAAQVTSPSTVSKNTRVERGEWVSGTYHAACSTTNA